jgi:drug/metabolite transporter (DMT)-like permease
MNNGVKILVFSLLCLIWSSTWLMIKVGLEGAPPMLGAGLRFIIASLVILAILHARKIRVPRTRRFLLLSAYLGIAQMGIPYALVYWSEQYISSGLTAVLFSTMPFMVAVLASVLLGDPLPARKIVGIIAGTAGVAVIFSDSLHYEGTQALYGMVAAVSSAFMASLASVIVKKYSKGYNPFASIMLPFAIGAVLLIAGGLTFERGHPVSFDAVTLATIGYLALLGTVGAFALYYWIIKHIDVTLLSYQTFIIPVLACLLGWIVLGEAVTIRILLGGALILSGIGLTMIKRKTRTGEHA